MTRLERGAHKILVAEIKSLCGELVTIFGVPKQHHGMNWNEAMLATIGNHLAETEDLSKELPSVRAALDTEQALRRKAEKHLSAAYEALEGARNACPAYGRKEEYDDMCEGCLVCEVLADSEGKR